MKILVYIFIASALISCGLNLAQEDYDTAIWTLNAAAWAGFYLKKEAQ